MLERIHGYGAGRSRVSPDFSADVEVGGVSGIVLLQAFHSSSIRKRDMDWCLKFCCEKKKM
jgi:hypothetical protein